MDDPSEQRHDNADVADILRRAIELQSEAGTSAEERGLARADGFTTEELKQIASEAGIDGRFIDAALADRSVRLAPPAPTTFFGASRCCLHGKVEGTLSRDRQAAIVGSLRNTTALQGRINETSLGIEWRADELTQLAVSISPQGDSTAIELIANRSAAVALLGFGTFLPTLILIVAIGEGLSLGLVPGLILVAFGLTAWLTTMVTVSRRSSRRWQEHLSRVLRDALAAARAVTPPELPAKTGAEAKALTEPSRDGGTGVVGSAV